MANFVTPDKTASRRFEPGGVYMGTVTRVDESINRVWVTIPRFITGAEFGPLAVVGPELPVVNDRVACLFVEKRTDNIVVIGVIKNQSTLPTSFVMVATSSTRPVSPRVGTIVYETDTEDIYVWSGTEWLSFFEVNLPATIYADLQGTAASAAFAVTAASATIASSVADNSVVLGNDTTGDYVSTITAGTNMSFTAGTGEGSTPTLATSTTPSFSTITSTVAIGTAPLTVTSNTLVTNLNADLLDGQEGSYYRSAANINAGTLPIIRGGTNSTNTPTDGGIAYGDGSGIAYTALGTSGQVLQSAGAGVPIWATYARGFIAQDTSTTTSSAATTSYQDTNLVFTSQAVTSGRKYKWTVTGHCYADNADVTIRMSLRNYDTSAVLASTDVLVSAGGAATGFTIVYYETAAASTLPRKVSVVRAGGTGNVYFFADADRVARFTIEDVGI
jgi:hypothetical protein